MARKNPGKPPSRREGRTTLQRSAEAYDPNDIRFVAMHEAGHAVSAIVLGIPLEYVEVKKQFLEDGTESHGYTRTPPIMLHDALGQGEEYALPHLAEMMAGPLAEMEINPRVLEYTGYEGDKQSALAVALFSLCQGIEIGDGSHTVTSEEQVKNQPQAKALLNKGIKMATDLVKKHLPSIIDVANTLIAQKSLTGDEVAAIVNDAETRPVSSNVVARPSSG